MPNTEYEFVCGVNGTFFITVPKKGWAKSLVEILPW
jgi:hypothetical protein